MGRIAQAQEYHGRARVRLPNARLYAAIHVVVETQIALGADLPVGRTLDRLQAEGLDRHEAIHAVGSILVDQIAELIEGSASAGEPKDRYWSALESPHGGKLGASL